VIKRDLNSLCLAMMIPPQASYQRSVYCTLRTQLPLRDLVRGCSATSKFEEESTKDYLFSLFFVIYRANNKLTTPPASEKMRYFVISLLLIVLYMSAMRRFMRRGGGGAERSLNSQAN
jgi:hypothetical protein